MLEAALFTALTSAPAVTSLVESRIFPDLAPQDAGLPLIVVTVVDDVPASSLNGAVANALSNARVQVDAYAPTRAQAAQVADAVKSALGDLKSAKAGGLDVWPASRRNLYDDETQAFRVLAEFNVWR